MCIMKTLQRIFDAAIEGKENGFGSGVMERCMWTERHQLPDRR